MSLKLWVPLPSYRYRRPRSWMVRGLIVLPGLVNTHHHLYQTLTRAVPAAQDVSLFQWLKVLYPIWARMDAEAVYVSAITGLAELILSGCTTASDHLYIYPNDVQLDDEIRAAREIGIRFHASRGSMSRGESQGGCPRMPSSKTKKIFSKIRGGLLKRTMIPTPYRCCRSWLHRAPPFQ